MLGFITYIQTEGYSTVRQYKRTVVSYVSWYMLCAGVYQLALACAWVYNLHTNGREQYSKTVKEDSSQLCLLVHALSCV